MQKVLVAGFEWFYPLTEFVIKGFKQNNCEVDRINNLYSENHLYFVRKLKQLKLYSYSKNILNKSIQKKLFKINHKNLLQKIRHKKFDLIFVIKGEYIHSETISQIKEITKNKTKLAIWHIDDPFFLWSNVKNPVVKKETIKSLSLFDNVFVFDSYFIDGIKRINKKINYLPFAVDVDTHQPVNKFENKKYNISFIGCYTPGRYKFLNSIKDFGLNLFGDNWKDLNKFKKDGLIPASKSNGIYNLTYINFNCHHQQTVYGCNTRTFEVLGSGNFLITDYRKDLEKLFEIGKEIETYNSIAELKEKVKYYLEHKNKLKQISEAGYKKSIEKHIYKIRIKKALETINL